MNSEQITCLQVTYNLQQVTYKTLQIGPITITFDFEGAHKISA